MITKNLLDDPFFPIQFHHNSIDQKLNFKNFNKSMNFIKDC